MSDSNRHRQTRAAHYRQSLTRQVPHAQANLRANMIQSHQDYARTHLGLRSSVSCVVASVLDPWSMPGLWPTMESARILERSRAPCAAKMARLDLFHACIVVYQSRRVCRKVLPAYASMRVYRLLLMRVGLRCLGRHECALREHALDLAAEQEQTIAHE